MSETTTAIFTEIRKITSDISEIKGDIKVIKSESEHMVKKEDCTKSQSALKDEVDDKMSKCSEKNHSKHEPVKSNVDWIKTLRNAILLFSVSSGAGAGIATAIMAVI